MKLTIHSIIFLLLAQLCMGQDEKEALDQLSNLEDIPFTLPKDWTYQKNPGNLSKGFKGIAGAPPLPEITVTVWGYEVDSFEQFVPLFKRDIKVLGGIDDVSVSLNDTLIDGLTIQNGKRFKWIGKHFKKNGELRMVAVGSAESEYEEKWETIKTIFNSINKD